jgi:hypothetical protein
MMRTVIFNKKGIIMRIKLICILVATCGLFVPFSAYSAPGYVHISDMSLVKYQLVSNGKVFFRNLNEFSYEAGITVTGCCYSFYLDTTTDYGKSAWSTILMKMASKQRLSLYLTETNASNSAPANVDHLGIW